MLMPASAAIWQADAVTSDQPLPRDEATLHVLRDRDGLLSEVVLSGDETLSVFNIAWGYDLGDGFAHVTTNISPEIAGTSIDFFSTEAVTAITDPETGATLFTPLS